MARQEGWADSKEMGNMGHHSDILSNIPVQAYTYVVNMQGHNLQVSSKYS